MIKAIEFPNKTFGSKLELFSQLKKNKDLIIAAKKAIKCSIPTTAKMATSNVKTKGVEVKENHSLHIINTTKLLDSHNDLHINGLWNKSIKDQKNKTYFLVNHNLEVGSVVAYPKDVDMQLLDVSWKDLGFDYTGRTQALAFEVNKENIRNKDARYIIENKVDIEHSIRMSYVKIELAINSDDEDFKEEKQVWDKYYPHVANKDDADDRGHMWIVKEARIHDEGSMVLRGSNFATPMFNEKEEVEIEEVEEKKDNKNYRTVI